jgi:hypothetical protein
MSGYTLAELESMPTLSTGSEGTLLKIATDEVRVSLRDSMMLVQRFQNRGTSWIRFLYPNMSGEVECDEDGKKIGVGAIKDRSTLHVITMSTDEQIRKNHTKPPPIKEGTERKPVAKKPEEKN